MALHKVEGMQVCMVEGTQVCMVEDIQVCMAVRIQVCMALHMEEDMGHRMVPHTVEDMGCKVGSSYRQNDLRNQSKRGLKNPKKATRPLFLVVFSLIDSLLWSCFVGSE
jgi:hypothetical protein